MNVRLSGSKGRISTSLDLEKQNAKRSATLFNRQQTGPRFAPNTPGTRPSFTPNKLNAPGVRPNFAPNKPNVSGVRPNFMPNKLCVPGLMLGFSPNKPNKPFMPRTPNQNSSFMQYTKKAGSGFNATSALQLNKPANQARPGKLPQYIDGDKKKTIKQKHITKHEFINDDMYKCGPDLEKAVDLELDDICKQFELGCETQIEAEKQAAQYVRYKSMPEFRKTMRLHVVKRLLKIGTNLLARIFAHGKPPKRIDVELALKPYGVTTLKKSKSSKLMYVATCDSFKNYDKLCSCEGIPLKVQGEDTVLVAKPFHLTMPFKFRRQLNKLKQKQADAEEKEGIPLEDYDLDREDLDENCTDDVDDDVQVIEARRENVNINESVVIDDASDDVVEVIETKTDAKTLCKDAVETKMESKVSTADITKSHAINTPTAKLAVNPLTTKSQAIKTEAGKPRAVNPQAVKLQAVNPQAGKSQAVNPQAAKLQAGKPQAVNAPAGKSQAVHPQAAKPQAGKPQAINAPAAKLAINPIAVKTQPGQPENGNKGLPKDGGVDEVGDVDVDEIAFDEEDLEDY